MPNETREQSYNKLRQLVEEYQANLAAPPSILEAGGGSTTHIPVRPGARVTVVDISDVQLSKNNYAHEKILADLHEVQLPSRQFDLAVCWDVLEHLRDPAVVLLKLLDSVKIGGLLIIAAPNQNSLTGLITKYTPHWFHVVVMRFLFQNKNAGKEGHAPFPTFMNKDMKPDALRSLAAGNGARTVYLELYESPRRQMLQEKHSLFGSLYNACLWLLNTTFQQKRRFELSDFFLVLQPYK